MEKVYNSLQIGIKIFANKIKKIFQKENPHQYMIIILTRDENTCGRKANKYRFPRSPERCKIRKLSPVLFTPPALVVFLQNPNYPATDTKSI